MGVGAGNFPSTTPSSTQALNNTNAISSPGTERGVLPEVTASTAADQSPGNQNNSLTSATLLDLSALPGNLLSLESVRRQDSSSSLSSASSSDSLGGLSGLSGLSNNSPATQTDSFFCDVSLDGKKDDQPAPRSLGRQEATRNVTEQKPGRLPSSGMPRRGGQVFNTGGQSLEAAAKAQQQADRTLMDNNLKALKPSCDLRFQPEHSDFASSQQTTLNLQWPASADQHNENQILSQALAYTNIGSGNQFSIANGSYEIKDHFYGDAVGFEVRIMERTETGELNNPGEKSTYFLFTGTHNTESMKSDLDPRGPGYTATEAFFHTHVGEIEQQMGEGKVVITGHSLGGAEALAFAESYASHLATQVDEGSLDIADTEKKLGKLQVETFGAPIADQANSNIKSLEKTHPLLAHILKDNTLNSFNKGDLVGESGGTSNYGRAAKFDVKDEKLSRVGRHLHIPMANEAKHYDQDSSKVHGRSAGATFKTARSAANSLNVGKFEGKLPPNFAKQVENGTLQARDPTLRL